jgi:hypothetical protein
LVNLLCSEPRGRWLIVQEIYQILLASRIHYALEEYLPSNKYQKIRTPRQIKEEHEGTCLDLAALFCGLCLANELLPLLIITKGHAFAAVSLTHSMREWDDYRQEYALFERGPLQDIAELRRLIQKGSWLTVECTGFAHSQKLAQMPAGPPECLGRNADGTMDFEQAVAAGAAQLDYEPRQAEFFALDIAIAQYGWGMIPYDEELSDRSAPGKLSLGPLASKMCDRTAQLTSFMELFLAHRPRPQVYIVHGDQKEAHDSFLQRVQVPLKKYLEAQGLIGISSNVVSWAHPGALADQMRELPRNLFTLFEQWSSADNSATALSQLPCLKRYSLVIISHNIDLAAWHNSNSPSLLCWYIKDYWGQLAVSENTPQFLIFIKIHYSPAQKKKGLLRFWRKDLRESIIECLSNLHHSVNQNCPFKVIEELTPVRAVDVKDWFEHQFPIRDLQRVNYLCQLFPEGVVCQPMAVVENFLENIISEFRRGLSYG